MAKQTQRRTRQPTVTPTATSATYPDPATPGFVELVKTHVSKRSERLVVLRVVEAVLRGLAFREDGGALSLVRALGDPRAPLTAHALLAPDDLTTRRDLSAVVVEHLRSALFSLVWSDPRVDLAARWRDARLALPKQAVALCRDLEDVYEGREPRSEVASPTPCRRRPQEDQRQVRDALLALREVRAVLTDDYESVRRADASLRDDEQRLLAVAKELLPVAASLPKALRWFREFAETLVDTLQAEAQARKDVVGLTFMALLPITGQFWRVVAALEKTSSASDGANVRLDKNKEYWNDEWYPRFAQAREGLATKDLAGKDLKITDERIIQKALRLYVRDLTAERTRVLALRNERIADDEDLRPEESDRLQDLTKWLARLPKPRTLRTHLRDWKREHLPSPRK